jgi:hypothetical protein
VKDETRRDYEERVHKAKKSLMGVTQLAEEKQELALWTELWGNLDRVQGMLAQPTCDTIDTFNLLSPTEKRVNKLLGRLTGVIPEEAEQLAVENVQVNSRAATIIRLMQESEQNMLRACELMAEAHPALEQLPLVQEWRNMASRIKFFPREVAKMRGIG